MKFRAQAPSQGFTVLEILVALAVLGVALQGFLGFFRLSNRQERRIELYGDLDLVKQIIRSATDCPTTLSTAKNPNYATPTCKGPIVLYRLKGTPITDAKGKIGNWKIDATCNASGIQVTATYPLGPNAYFSDPGFNIPFDKSHPKAKLFGNGLNLCSAGAIPKGKCQTETYFNPGQPYGKPTNRYCTSPTAVITGAWTVAAPNGTAVCGTRVRVDAAGRTYSSDGGGCVYAGLMSAGSTSWATEITCCEFSG